MQPFRRMGQKVAMFVNRAALNADIRPQGRQGFFTSRRAPSTMTSCGAFRPRATGSSSKSPSGFALVAHDLDGEQNFLAVGAHANCDDNAIKSR